MGDLTVYSGASSAPAGFLRNILIVDEDRNRHQKLHEILIKQGVDYRAGHAFSARDAVEKMKKGPKLHLLLLDHPLVGSIRGVHNSLCGCAVLTEIVMLEPVKRPSIIILHGLDSDSVDKLERKMQGVRESIVVRKPWGTFNIDVREL